MLLSYMYLVFVAFATFSISLANVVQQVRVVQNNLPSTKFCLLFNQARYNSKLAKKI